MRLSFYPGCSLEGMANDYCESIYAVFKDLGIDLVEIEDWSCCGATAAHSLSEVMSVILPARNLAAAEEMGLDILCPCSLCFNRLLFSQKMIKKKIFHIPWEVTGSIQVLDMTRFLAKPSIIELIKQCVLKPLDSLKVVCYYGCQMVRPPKITGYADYENPQTLDIISSAAGAHVVDAGQQRAAVLGLGIRQARAEDDCHKKEKNQRSFHHTLAVMIDTVNGVPVSGCKNSTMRKCPQKRRAVGGRAGRCKC